MKTVLAISAFLWTNRELIAKAVPLIIEAKSRFNNNAGKKVWVTNELLLIKDFTPDSVDKAIDAIVQVLQWKGVL